MNMDIDKHVCIHMENLAIQTEQSDNAASRKKTYREKYTNTEIRSKIRTKEWKDTSDAINVPVFYKLMITKVGRQHYLGDYPS
uniref:Uncharacterized protein n=1 Tax=Romanomermis culicivorax TaxID=13658 RepID=A0A915J6E0_ROMCU